MRVSNTTLKKFLTLQHDVLILINKYKNYGEDQMANKFESFYSKLDAAEHHIEDETMDDIKLNRLLPVWTLRKDVMVAENVHNQTEAKKLSILTKPENVEILGKENIQLYFRQMLPPPAETDKKAA